MDDPVGDAVDALIDGMFDAALNVLVQIVSNDLAVLVMGLLSLTLLTAGFFMVYDFFGMGLSEKEKALKSSYDNWQRNKDNWRGAIYRKEYQQNLGKYHDDSDEQAEQYENGGGI